MTAAFAFKQGIDGSNRPTPPLEKANLAKIDDEQRIRSVFVHCTDSHHARPPQPLRFAAIEKIENRPNSRGGLFPGNEADSTHSMPVGSASSRALYSEEITPAKHDKKGKIHGSKTRRLGKPGG